MKTEKSLMVDGDRYLFDWKLCTVKKGWAQFDTSQDAWYFGVWINPFERKITSYMEGDIYRETYGKDQEFVAGVFLLINWNLWYDPRKKPGIDPLGSDRIEKKFIELGLGEWIH